MTEYLAPGVYVEEVGSTLKPIEGVATSTVGFIGLAAQGPLTPTLVTSFDDFAALYGSDCAGAYLPCSVRGFFENGGRRCYITRLGLACVSAVDEALAALADIDEIALLCSPDEHCLPDAQIAQAMVSHCERLRNRMVILQAREDAGPLGDLEPYHASSYAAFYYPWINITDPLTQQPRTIPPGGHIAGVYARVDEQRGVHKAPANESLLGLHVDPTNPSAGLQVNVTEEEQALLNPRGVNVLRHFPGRGVLVWGARTSAPDPEWKYVNVRRLFIFIEQSIDRGTRWVAFEPNTEPTWQRVRGLVENFLVPLWRAGLLQGRKPDEAFFVRCDRTTMTQNDIDNGQLICEVGIAPVRPAEFVIIRIGQWACCE